MSPDSFTLRLRSLWYAWPLFLAAATLAVAAPSVSTLLPSSGSTVSSLTQVSITFNEAVSGVDVLDLEINGAVASQVTGSGAGPYVFVFTQPEEGTVSLAWSDSHGIAGLGTGAFVPGASWSYVLEDAVAPSIAQRRTSVVGQESWQIDPAPGASVVSLTQTRVMFSEIVSGVDASDLLINGVAASSVTGSDAGPYVFSFASPADGAVNFTWASTTNIVDGQGNAFVAVPWTVQKIAVLGSVVITEFLAANAGAVATTANGTRDENFDLSGWIELMNTGASAVDLSGWSLTDDADDDSLWVFPQRTLAAGARLIVWASGKDRKPTSGHLHTNFTLGIDGGYVALHRPEYPRGAAVSRFPQNYNELSDPPITSYPPQRFDYSYGLQDGDGALRYFSPPSVTQAAYTLPTSANPTPTPPVVPTGVTNGTSNIVDITPAPTANVARGFFRQPFSVILSCTDPDAQIRYTINGSLPQASDPLYSAPIAISGTTVLRFAAFSANRIPSDVVTQTYLFADQILQQKSPPYDANNPVPTVGGVSLPLHWGTSATGAFPGLITNLAANQIPADYGVDAKIYLDPERYNDQGQIDPAGSTNEERIKRGLRTLPVLSIVMKNDDMWGTGGLYPSSSANNKADNTKLCSMEMFSADGSTIFASTAGLDLHGNASRDPFKTPKHGFTVRFKDRYGNGRLKAKLFPDSNVEEFDKFVLRADFGVTWLHWDISIQQPKGIRIRDPFVKDTFRDMGGQCGYGRFVNLFINGIYWGTYDIAEDEAQDFAASHFGGEKEQYDIVEQGTLKNGNWTAYRAMKQILGWTGATFNTVPTSTVLASAFNNTQYESIKQYLDVPWYCDYMIHHYFVGHEDWGTEANYNKNWYVLRHQNGKFRYIPWDQENTLLSENVNRVTGAPYPPTAIQPRLTKNAQFKLDFADRVHRHMVSPDGALLPARNISRMQKWTSIMNADAMCLESARWGDYRDYVHPYTNDSGIVYTWNGKWRVGSNTVSSATNWLTEIGRLTNTYFPARTTTVLSQFRTAGLYPTLNAPQFVDHVANAVIGSKQVPAGFLLRMQLPTAAPGTTSAGTIFYTTDGSDPRVYYDTTGATTASAQTYVSPLALSQTTTIKSRVRDGTTWSALCEATYVVGDALPQVAISEIHYRPNSGGTAREFVEVHNAGATAVDLSGWYFSGIDFLVPHATMMPPGARWVIASNDNPAAFAAVYPSVVVFGYFGGTLDNSDERISLRDREGNIISSVHYDDTSPWPTSPDGGGPSLELMDSLGDAESPALWQASANTHGSPGQANAAAPSVGVRLSEFAVASVQDFVEIENAGAASVSLSGWQLQVKRENQADILFSLTGQSLTPGQRLVVSANMATGDFPAQQGMIFLKDATGKARDAVRYGPQVAQKSFCRINNAWVLGELTAGTINQAATIADASALVINEVFANPAAGEDDWLELTHAANHPVVLTGLQIRRDDDWQRIDALTAIAPLTHVRLYADLDSGRGDTLHLRLPAEGATIDLLKANGTLIHQVTYGAQSVDQSIGRWPDRTGDMTVLPVASPAAPNHLLLASNIRISEILVKNQQGLINPWARRSAWIELWNDSSATVSLNGWKLRSIGEEKKTWPFPASGVLAAGVRQVIHADPQSDVSQSAPYRWNCGLAIDSERYHDYAAWGIELLNPLDQVVERITWGMQIADRSMGRDASGAWVLLGSPTPGATNATAASLGSPSMVKINEWTGSDLILPGMSFGEFVELYNPQNLPVDVSQLWLGDEPSESGVRKWKFPANSFVAAMGHGLLLPSTGSSDPARLSFAVQRGGEMLLLSDETQTWQNLSFGAASDDRSLGRSPDGSETVADLLPTPGSANVMLGVGAPVIYAQPSGQSMPAGTSYELRIAAHNATSYQWYRNNQAIPLAVSPQLLLPILTAADDGLYHCVASNALGSTNSIQVAVTVLYNATIWSAEHQLTDLQGDDDGDGMVNGMEFLCGSDPHQVNAPWISSAIEHGEESFIRYTFRRSSRVVWEQLTGDASSNLQNWTTQWPDQQEILDTQANGDQIIRYGFLIPEEQSRYFLRLSLKP